MEQTHMTQFLLCNLLFFFFLVQLCNLLLYIEKVRKEIERDHSCQVKKPQCWQQKQKLKFSTFLPLTHFSPFCWFKWSFHLQNGTPSLFTLLLLHHHYIASVSLYLNILTTVCRLLLGNIFKIYQGKYHNLISNY